jgi:integrase
MPRETTGQIRRGRRVTSARVRVVPNDARWFRLAVTTDEDVAARTALLVSYSARLQGIVPADDIATVLTETAAARTPAQMQEAQEAVDALESGEAKTVGAAQSPTFEAFAVEWTSGKLRKKHPDHVREKDHDEDKQILRDRINPHMGRKRLPDVTLEDAENVMRAMDPKLSATTRRHTAQCMRKVFSLAVYPGRHIAANPIPKEWMPKAGKGGKAKTCLYPAEEAKLLKCAAVLLERRVAYGVLAREGLRASELAGLRWRDVDLVRGSVRLDANKTNDPRAWALSPDVACTLAWWKKRTKGDAGDLVLTLDLTQGPRWLRGKVWDPKTGHKNERGDLLTAGVDRAELFERSKVRQPLRLHDLRALFVTTALANGKTEAWVSARTGHRSSQMIATYTRQARLFEELGLGPLLPMDALLPEMRGARRPKIAMPPSGAGERSSRSGRGRPSRHERAVKSSDCRTRTYDPAVNSRLLYQLS